jgi:hypothetical protein
MHSVLKAAIAISLLCGAAACTTGDSLNDPASATPLTPPASSTPPTTPPTETFSTTLAFGGTNAHPFTTTQTGAIDVLLVSTAPSPTSRLQIGVGIQNSGGNGCSLKFAELVVYAQPGPLLAVPGESQPAGAYCVSVEDTFNVGPLTYTIQVWHH